MTRRRLAALGLLLAALGAVLTLPLRADGEGRASRRISLRPGVAPGEVVWVGGAAAVEPLPDVGGWRGLLLGAPLDPNSATAADLDALPGIGGTGAAEILKIRAQLGAISSEGDLLLVKGIGPKKLEAIRPWLTLAGPGA